jgi:hypothetical protein
MRGEVKCGGNRGKGLVSGILREVEENGTNSWI